VKAPYALDGSLQHYPESWFTGETEMIGGWPLRKREGPYWLEAKPFTCTLVLDDMRRGQSAAYFMWRELDSEVTYSMFIRNMTDLVKAAVLDHGKVTGTWAVIKRGQNYGIKLVSVC
jgi:hypothetical protein